MYPQPQWGESGFLASDQLLKDMKKQNRELDRKLVREMGAGALGAEMRGAAAMPGYSGVPGSKVGETQTSEVASSSAMDQASESSASDVPVSSCLVLIYYFIRKSFFIISSGNTLLRLHTKNYLNFQFPTFLAKW